MTCNATEHIVWTMDESQKLGKNLKRIRMKKDISQGDISRALKVHKGYISNIENGKVNPTLATIVRLAEAIDVSPSVLLK
jgi:transcriptional regulator with XRE-family HTH domain